MTAADRLRQEGFQAGLTAADRLRQEGMQQGFQAGKTETARDIAINLLMAKHMNIDIATIASITHLSIAEINALKASLETTINVEF